MQNNFIELWTLLDFVQPNCLGLVTDFRKFYVTPIKHGQRKDSTKRELILAKLRIKSLNETVKEIVLRRDMTVIQHELPGKVDHIVFCKMVPLQLRMYRRLINSNNFVQILRYVQPCTCGSGFRGSKCCYKPETTNFEYKKHIFPAMNLLQKIALRMI